MIAIYLSLKVRFVYSDFQKGFRISLSISATKHAIHVSLSVKSSSDLSATNSSLEVDSAKGIPAFHIMNICLRHHHKLPASISHTAITYTAAITALSSFRGFSCPPHTNSHTINDTPVLSSLAQNKNQTNPGQTCVARVTMLNYLATQWDLDRIISTQYSAAAVARCTAPTIAVKIHESFSDPFTYHPPTCLSEHTCHISLRRKQITIDDPPPSHWCWRLRVETSLNRRSSEASAMPR